MAFDLAAKLREAATNLNTPGAEQIEYIPFDLLDPDEANFYSLDGLDELADSIATVGILTPLRVRANGERYTITSGHRRRAAVKLLIDSGEDWSRGLPCIVDRGESTPEWEELKLIFANRQRVKTSAELSREAERTDELFCALKEKGYDFPGRMQDHVAQALGVKASKLKRLHAIRNRAQEYVLDAYDQGRINESVAYELSQAPKDLQKMIIVQMLHANRPLSELTAEQVAKITDARNNMANRGCYFNKNVRCAYVNVRMDEALRRRFRGSKVGNCQKGGCCKGCPALLECEAYCCKCETDRQQKEAEQTQRRAELEKIHQEAEASRTDGLAAIPNGYRQTGLLFCRVQRIRRAAEASGADLRHVFSMRSLSERDLETYLSIINGGPDPTHELDELFDDTDELAVLADDLECSTDFLLGRTEEPEINRGETPSVTAGGGGSCKTDEGAAWSTGTPKRKGWYAVKVSKYGEKAGAPMLLLWGDSGWSLAGGAATIHSSYTVEKWHRIPE